jgi:hypothetical protein
MERTVFQVGAILPRSLRSAARAQRAHAGKKTGAPVGMTVFSLAASKGGRLYASYIKTFETYAILADQVW